MAASLHADPTALRGELQCPMCGCRYDPRQHAACAGCPLNPGCALSCCPACGFSSADPSASLLARAFRKLGRQS